MKKLLRYADCFVLLGAILGCLLRFWLRNAAAGAQVQVMTHPAWLLLCLMSVAVVAFVALVTRYAGDQQAYPENFPKSMIGGVTYILLATVLGYSGITGLVQAANFLSGLTAVFSMIAAVCLAVAAIERFCGNQPVFFVHMLPCIYFALRLFDMGRDFGSQPELHTFLFSFLASLCLVPAYYWLWSFDVQLGNRRRSLFWSLTAAFFCLLATFDAEAGWALYLLHGAVLLSNLCRLQPLEAPQAPEELPQQPAEAAEPSTAEKVPMARGKSIFEELSESDTETAVEQMPALQPEPVAEPAPAAEPEEPVLQQKPALHANMDPEEDMDAFLEELKLFLDSESY